jgi:hypothetical protein
MVAVALEEAGRDRDLQLRRQRLHGDDRGMLQRRPGQREQRLVLDLAEIGAGKQLGRQDHLRALRAASSTSARRRRCSPPRRANRAEAAGRRR